MKLKKHLAGMINVLLVLVICMSNNKTVFAADAVWAVGTPENQAGAAITKVLQMPQGTAIPTATFTFDIQKISIDADSSDTSIAAMPDLEAKVVVTGSSDTYTINDDKMFVIKNTGNFLAGKTWSQTGEYIYKVTETANSYGITNAAQETLIYSQAEYELHVYIAETEAGVFYVKSAGAVIAKDQNGATYGFGEKVDSAVPDEISAGNGFSFVNTYTKTPGGGAAPDPDTQSVAISKTVVGELASKTKYFPFEVIVSNNSLISTNTYKAYICTLSNNVYTKVLDENANNQYDAGKDYISFTAGAARQIDLKHDQQLVFMDCPQGTVYQAEEKALPGYKAAVHIVTGGSAVTPDAANSSANTALSTGHCTIISGGANKAVFTNTHLTTIPTGIITNNLPFIIMMLAGIIGFAGFIIKKIRKTGR